MSENLPSNTEPKLPIEDRPFIDEAIEIGAENKRKKLGTPILKTLEETEDSAEQQEDTTLMRAIKRVKKRLFGS